MKNLSVQEFADELGVSRQLIYYHAKKIKEDDKVYDETNRLVFTPEQQLKLQSFMTIEEVKEDKTKESALHDEVQQEDDKDENLEEKIREEEIKEPFDKDLSNEKVAEEIQDQADEALFNKELQTDEVETEKEIDETIVESEENIAKDHSTESEMNESVTDFIRTYVRQYMDQDDDPAKTMEQYFKLLEQQLYEKDLHIDRLARLLDQQQQLLLVEQQKNMQLRLEYSNISYTKDSDENHNNMINESQTEKETTPSEDSNPQQEQPITDTSSATLNQPSVAPKKWWQFWK